MINLHLSLSDKISITIATIGLFCILLVYYISNSYMQFAYTHHRESLQQLAQLEIEDLIANLRSSSHDLALSIENQDNFKRDFRLRYKDDLSDALDNQFQQYFVTAGIIKVLKLYVLDTGFSLVSSSTEGAPTKPGQQLICPKLGQKAIERTGPEKLQILSRSCLFEKRPVYAVMIPFGGLKPKGYIQVVTDFAYSMQKLEQSLAMPVEITSIDDKVLYRSSNWQQTNNGSNFISVELPIKDVDNEPIMKVSLLSDMTEFNDDVIAHRNWVMSLTFIATGLIVFFVIMMLQRSTIPPLAKIHDVLEKIHLNTSSNTEDSRLLFEQLLEQIIKLRKKSGLHFTVMILDLTQFKNINDVFGTKTGDKLLLEVEDRLSTVLRGSDLISWVGTDTPGHKLLPSGTKTQYRATIARLGGDEFGLLLPSAETAEQANAVAGRIVEALNRSFDIDDHQIDIGCCIGISIYPEHGEDEKILIRNADKAMYQAKALDQSVFVFDGEL